MADKTPAVTVFLPGPPRGKGRPKFRVIHARSGKSFANAYTDAKTRDYEAMLRDAAQQAMGDQLPLDCPIRVVITTIHPIPASWSRLKWENAKNGLTRPTGKPDFDNLAKSIDALNGIVWRDDSLVVSGQVEKWYGEKPSYQIQVWKWSPTLV